MELVQNVFYRRNTAPKPLELALKKEIRVIVSSCSFSLSGVF